MNWVLEVLPLCFDKYIIGKKQTKKNIKVINDLDIGRGPVRGIYTALKKIDSEYIFVIGGDMPFIKRELVNAMMELIPKTNNYDVIVPINKGFYEPLFAIYNKEIEDLLYQQISNGNNKINSLFLNLNVLRLENSFWEKYDPRGESFLNINKKADLIGIH